MMYVKKERTLEEREMREREKKKKERKREKERGRERESVCLCVHLVATPAAVIPKGNADAKDEPGRSSKKLNVCNLILSAFTTFATLL